MAKFHNPKRVRVPTGVAAVVAAAAFAATVVAAPRGPGPVCSGVPIVFVGRNDLGFRVGWPNSIRAGARGHAKVNLATGKVSGVGCQVNGDGGGILFSIG